MFTVFRPRIMFRVIYCLWYGAELNSIRLIYLREACSKMLPLLIPPLDGSLLQNALLPAVPSILGKRDASLSQYNTVCRSSFYSGLFDQDSLCCLAYPAPVVERLFTAPCLCARVWMLVLLSVDTHVFRHENPKQSNLRSKESCVTTVAGSVAAVCHTALPYLVAHVT